jgi:hypothetical protein
MQILVKYVAAEQGVLTEVQLAAERDLVGKLRQRLQTWSSLHEAVLRQAEGLGDADYVDHCRRLGLLADEFRALADSYLKVQLRAVREASEANMQQYRASSRAHERHLPAATTMQLHASSSSSSSSTQATRKPLQQGAAQVDLPRAGPSVGMDASGTAALSSTNTAPWQLPDFREVTMRYRRTAMQYRCYMDQSLYRRKDARAGMPSACDSYYHTGQLAGAAAAAAGQEPFSEAVLPAAAADWAPDRQLPGRAYGRVLPPRGLLMLRSKQLEAQLAQQQGDGWSE